jgi:hypothetical protein
MDDRYANGEDMGAEMPTEGDGTSNGFSVELYVGADGQMSINVESAAEEADQHGGDPMEGGTPVAGLKEAIQMIMDIVKNNGKMTDPAEGDAEFSEGFGPEQKLTPGPGVNAKRFG